MKQMNTLAEMITYLKNKHNFTRTKEGAYGMKFLKRPSGQRILIEEFNGFRSLGYMAHEPNGLVITQYASGIRFKGIEKITMSSKLFLMNLVIINVYDHVAEFFSTDGIDFAYAENGHVAEMELLDEMFREPGPIRAKWVWENPDIKQMLEEIDRGRRIKVAPSVGRDLDLTLNL